MLTIPKRQVTCVCAKKKFIPGMDYYSTLDKIAGKRLDYCFTCWEKSKTASKNLTFWKGKIPLKDKDAMSSPLIDYNAQALNLLKMALEEQEIEKGFVLALLLVRYKKLLYCHESREESGKIFFIYEVVKTGEKLAIEKIELSARAIEKIQATLARELTIKS